MNNSPSKFYHERIIGLNADLKALNKNFSQFIGFRIMVVLLLFISTYLLFSSKLSYLYVPIEIVLLGLFVWLVQKHLQLKRKIRTAEKLIEVNKHEINAFTGDFSAFDSGLSFQDFAHRNAYDLDLFGPRSLYNRLNRCTTTEGSERLSEMIKNQNSAHFNQKQERLKELAQKAIWRQKFRVKGLLESKNVGFKELELWFGQETVFNKNRLLRALSKFSPYIMLLSFILLAFGIIPAQFIIMYFIFQLLITGAKFKAINQIHVQVSKKQEVLDAYSGLLQEFESENFNNQVIQEWQKKAMGGFVAINKFKKLIGLLDSRLNMAMGVLLNGVLLWDINLVIRIEDWKVENRDNLKTWIDVIAQIEAENSLANYVFNHSGFAWPQIHAANIVVAEELSHPFLNEKNRVSNNFSLEAKGQLVLLSGANMSGKSTFLRTVGLNLVLANMGLPVCAKSFLFKPMAVYTSMRINDSLLESESYFYAELKRLKFIIDTIKRGEEIFVLLDEILRGTNSNDKHNGSAGLIKQLLALQTSGIVASHDISLSILEHDFPQKLLNKSFEVENENGELVFDYKLRDGVCKNLNATYLMEKMGVI